MFAATHSDARQEARVRGPRDAASRFIVTAAAARIGRCARDRLAGSRRACVPPKVLTAQSGSRAARRSSATARRQLAPLCQNAHDRYGLQLAKGDGAEAARRAVVPPNLLAKLCASDTCVDRVQRRAASVRRFAPSCAPGAVCRWHMFAVGQTSRRVAAESEHLAQHLASESCVKRVQRRVASSRRCAQLCSYGAQWRWRWSGWLAGLGWRASRTRRLGCPSSTPCRGPYSPPDTLQTSGLKYVCSDRV